jgi:hypothetical protein
VSDEVHGEPASIEQSPSRDASPAREVGRRASPYVVLFLAGATLGAAGATFARHTPNPQGARFLNFDPESMSPGTLGKGWAGFEHDESGDTFVWCAAESCTLFIDLPGDRDRLLRVRMWAMRYAGAPAQIATANLNGVQIDRRAVGEEPIVWALPVAATAWKEGKNELRFDFTYAEAPIEHDPQSSDARTLSAAFDWLEIVPR